MTSILPSERYKCKRCNKVIHVAFKDRTEKALTGHKVGCIDVEEYTHPGFKKID